jgi:hypothetical protein
MANIIHLPTRALAAIPLPPNSRVACSICGIDWEMRRNIAFSIVKTVTYFGAFIFITLLELMPTWNIVNATPMPFKNMFGIR